MFDQYTERARKTIFYSLYEARMSRSFFIQPERSRAQCLPVGAVATTAGSSEAAMPGRSFKPNIYTGAET
jgi:hypothetical protein